MADDVDISVVFEDVVGDDEIIVVGEGVVKLVDETSVTLAMANSVLPRSRPWKVSVKFLAAQSTTYE